MRAEFQSGWPSRTQAYTISKPNQQTGIVLREWDYAVTFICTKIFHDYSASSLNNSTLRFVCTGNFSCNFLLLTDVNEWISQKCSGEKSYPQTFVINPHVHIFQKVKIVVEICMVYNHTWKTINCKDLWPCVVFHHPFFSIQLPLSYSDSPCTFVLQHPLTATLCCELRVSSLVTCVYTWKR